jgi:hypothetical protein
MESHDRKSIVENMKFDVVRRDRRKTGLICSKKEECSCHILRHNGTKIWKEKTGE